MNDILKIALKNNSWKNEGMDPVTYFSVFLLSVDSNGKDVYKRICTHYTNGHDASDDECLAAYHNRPLYVR